MSKPNWVISVLNFYLKISTCILKSIEDFFYNLGFKVSSFPWTTILISWLFVLTSALGLLRFHIEKNPIKLWVPPESDFATDTEWIIDKYGSGFREQTVIVTAPNVLTPQVISAINELNTQINNISVTHNDISYSWNDICFKVPTVPKQDKSSYDRKTRSVNSDSDIQFSDDLFRDSSNEFEESTAKSKEFDPSVDLDHRMYCKILENFKYTCLQETVLDIWNYDSKLINNLQLKDILADINKPEKSPSLGDGVKYTSLLSGVKRNQEGMIISAEAIRLTWYAHVNFSSVNLNEVGNIVGTEDWVSEGTLKWEAEFLKVIENYRLVYENLANVKLYYSAGRSFGDISGEAMFGDIDKLAIGIFFMFIYILLILSRWKNYEIKLTLASLGLLCVGMSFVVASGLGSILAIPYGPIHISLPFLLMGLGVDDMFVMKACWESLSDTDKTKSIPVQVGLMLKHAGISIVITSFTDIIAFLIGSITILPCLQSFCLYAALGVFFIFCFSVTFYVAVFTIDVRRVLSKRNAIFFCIRHKSSKTEIRFDSCFNKIFIWIYERLIFTLIGRVFVIILTLVMVLFSAQAVLNLEQRFDPNWFIPDGTYYKHFLEKQTQHYPKVGYKAAIFTGEVDYSKEFINIYRVVGEMQNYSAIQDLDSWTHSFKDYVLLNFKKDISLSIISQEEWNTYLSKFLFSSTGAKYQLNFRFSEVLRCGEIAPNIKVSSIEFYFQRFTEPSKYLPMMHKAKDIAKSANLLTGDKYISVWSKAFANWVTDEIIALEVQRNLQLTLLCVMCCSSLLIMNFQMSFWLFVCVLLTILNVCGWMYRMGLTIDIVSCIALELAIGLCVDYAAHVGHTYLTICKGTKQDRALETVKCIGVAVLYGGGATLLSLCMLGSSKAYTFQAFFKIFLLVVIFGLFHGIVFLPVILTFVGPSGYTHCKDLHSNDAHNCDELQPMGKNVEKKNSFDNNKLDL